MALKWFLNSAFTQVLLGHMDTVTGQKGSEIIACPNNRQGQEEFVKSFKDGKEPAAASSIIMKKEEYPNGFQVPLHYPRYSKADYQKMEEWKLDMLLHEYGLCFKGTLDDKRAFAMGAFLWPDQL